MVLGIFLFCCNDALGKWLLGTYSVWQMLVIRSIAAMLLLVAVHLARGQGGVRRRAAAGAAGAARVAVGRRIDHVLLRA